MSTAIERVEAWLDGNSIAVSPRIDDLTELVRLAKLGERVEQCKASDPTCLLIETADGQRTYYAWRLLARIKGES